MPKCPEEFERDLQNAVEAGNVVTTPERAADIAALTKFGLKEFIELTGVGECDYGIYRISRDGVALLDTTLKDLHPGEQFKALDAEENLSLKFPCSPFQFQEWYESTRGTNGVSDFSLALGFLKALAGPGDQHGQPVTSSAIMKAFRKMPNDGENEKWWDDRLRGAKKYKLTDARALLGRAKIQSMWHPALVASWLIEKKHMNRVLVLKAMEANFPESDTSLL